MIGNLAIGLLGDLKVLRSRIARWPDHPITRWRDSRTFRSKNV